MKPLPPELRIPLLPPLAKELARQAHACGYDRVLSQWLEDASLCYRLALVPDGDTSAVGASRYGGLPDLPEGKAWPRNDQGAFVFAQQIDLAAVPPVEGSPLPPEGLLSLFIEDDALYGDWSGRFHVFCFRPEDGPLVRAEPPGVRFVECADRIGKSRPYRIQPVPAIGLPWCGDQLDAYQERLYDEGKEEDDKTWQFLRGAFGVRDWRLCGGMLLGHPYGSQADHVVRAILKSKGKAKLYPAYETPRDTLDEWIEEELDGGDRKEAQTHMDLRDAQSWLHTPAFERLRAAWTPLWRVDANPLVGFRFWDMGYISIYVPTVNLRRGDFSILHAEIECS